MQKSTNNKQEELLNTQLNAEETHKENSSLFDSEPVVNTPFTMVTTETGTFLTMGNYRITEPYQTKEEAKDQLNNIWDIMLKLAIIVAQTEIKTREKTLEEEKLPF